MHRELGPYLNEYMYQEALDILFEENNVEKVREYYITLLRHAINVNVTIWTTRQVICLSFELFLLFFLFVSQGGKYKNSVFQVR